MPGFFRTENRNTVCHGWHNSLQRGCFPGRGVRPGSFLLGRTPPRLSSPLVGLVSFFVVYEIGSRGALPRVPLISSKPTETFAMLNKFLTRLLTTTAAPGRRGRPARRNSPDRRLQMESLEDRLTLTRSRSQTTGTVGPGRCGTVSPTPPAAQRLEFRPVRPLHHADIRRSGDSSKNLDIEGPGAGKLTINGNNASLAMASRVFDISGSATVTIAGLTIANGEAVVTQYWGERWRRDSSMRPAPPCCSRTAS